MTLSFGVIVGFLQRAIAEMKVLNLDLDPRLLEEVGDLGSNFLAVSVNA